jgi:monovalent cation:H+ antiporter, CPA1 family
MHIFDIITVLLLLSGLFIFINSFYLKLAPSIGLMILALGLSIVVMKVGAIFPDFHLAEHVKAYDFQEVISQFVLSTMLFAAALNVDFRKLGDQLTSVLVLSFVGVLISTFVIAGLVYFLSTLISIEITFLETLIFGALISSTDPIAVNKTIGKYHIASDLKDKISGESMLNSSFAVVLALVLANVYDQSQSEALVLYDISLIFIIDICGGIVLGILLGWIGFSILKFIDNDAVQVEVLMTLALVMTGSLVAELIFVSSKLAVVLAGLIIGNYRQSSTEDAAMGSYVRKFWRLLEESFASMLFVLIGFEMLIIPLRWDYFAAGFFTVNIVLFARWISIYIPIRAMSTFRKFNHGTISMLSWGALRGGLPIAVALSIPQLQSHSLIVTMTFVVVICSVLYQGLTIGSLMEKYNVAPIIPS